MNVRPFDWRDIPALNRSQQDSVFLDSALLLTRGPLLVPGALLSYLAPAMGVFTGVVENNAPNGAHLMGQIIHLPGSPFAHLTFMAPSAALSQPPVSALTEYLVTIAGERGAMRLLADVDEHANAFEALHQSGFAIYTRQRIWQLKASPGPIFPAPAGPEAWRAARSQDAIAIRSLYNNLVPGMVQQIEPLLAHKPHGMVYHHKGELRAYVEFKHGHRGIWVHPFVHPDTEDIRQHLAVLFNKLASRFSRPFYICVRSYQAWLEPAIEEMGAAAGERRAVLVKHLMTPQKAARSFALPALEGGQAEISAPPLAHVENRREYSPTKNLWNK